MNSLSALAPLLSLAVGSLALLLLEAFLKRTDKSYLGYLSLPFLAGCGFFAAGAWGEDLSYFGGTLVLDRTAIVLVMGLVLTAIFIVLMSLKYLAQQGLTSGEYYPLLLLALSGAVIMVTSGNLLVVFLGLEVLSVSSYALTGLKRNDPKSSEAAVKYFLMGSFASAFLVFGMAFVHGIFGGLEIAKIAAGPHPPGGPSAAGIAGLVLVIVGFGFKLALVPFHMWAPDVYEGAPTPVTSFISIGPKLAGVAVLFRLLTSYGSGAPGEKAVTGALWTVAVLTMLVGNLAALRQRNLKRILAYSSIAHSGYILVGLLAGDGASLLFYLVAYLFMNAGAFSALVALGDSGRECLDLEDLSGVGLRYPWIGASLSILLLSLAGFPPTAGFLAKFYVFGAAVREGFIVLVIVAVLASLVSVFYYLRLIVYMYMRPAEAEVRIDTDNPGPQLVLYLCVCAVVQAGIWPGNILAFIRQAAAALF